MIPKIVFQYKEARDAFESENGSEGDWLTLGLILPFIHAQGLLRGGKLLALGSYPSFILAQGVSR